MIISSPNPERWIAQLFSSRAAQKGAVVRRSVAWVEREVGHAAFQIEIKRRGYHLIRTANQYIVICHNGPIDILF
ncbi:N-(5'-phosphoribosyl)anthranilate isomerase [uncultured Ruegeria sp.]|uniref:N-(5'-phosphoribosyl)anthranilate isomerase n=1 Tax=uncultured Ruegeria sp. TaxID=259304 RepID=UPI0026324766|nr:N-(5'-phosphoribosyl)anthranilate isomerase [uncultured Ruegeria sp.]